MNCNIDTTPDFALELKQLAKRYPKLNRGEFYWIDKKITYAVYTNQYAINLSNGQIDGWDFQWHNPEKHFILAIDYLNY